MQHCFKTKKKKTLEVTQEYWYEIPLLHKLTTMCSKKCSTEYRYNNKSDYELTQ